MFPLKKTKITLNDSETSFLKDYSSATEIPLLPHPGAFSKQRKKHIHEGIDLYCNNGDNVYAMESGTVVKIKPFTGDHVGTPWWENTWCVMVASESGVINYGEIVPDSMLYEGMVINEGDIVGTVKTVLTKDKGRPMTMLHLELYTHGTTDAIDSWGNDTEKPSQLLDPTDLFLKYLTGHHNDY